MGYTQLITPDPYIRCTPGWCLMYVREAFGLPARHPTATAAWEASTSQHRDRNFPAGVAVPVWYGLDREPAGHVVLRMPDGSVYSTSDNTNTPHHHPDLADLEAFYAAWGWPLTYRGWTEDVAGFPVITEGGIAAQGTIKSGDILDMANEEQLNRLLRAADRINGVVRDAPVLNVKDGAYMNNTRDAQHAAVMAALDTKLDKDDGNYIVNLVKATEPGAEDPEAAAENILKILPEAIASQVLVLLGQKLGEK